MNFETCAHCHRDLRGRYRTLPNGLKTCDNGICYSNALRNGSSKNEKRRPFLLTL